MAFKIQTQEQGYADAVKNNTLISGLKGVGVAPKKGAAQDKAAATRAAAAKAAAAKAAATKKVTPVARTGSSTSKSFSSMLKSQATSASRKPVTTGQSAIQTTPGQQYLAGAQEEFGYNPSVGYNPVDTSQIANLLGKWDPNSINQIYDPAYQNLDRLRTQGKADYATGDTKLADIYRTLTNQITQSADQVGVGYQQANNNIKADATMLSGAAAADAQAITGRREQMLQNLGIQAAAPDLTANDQAATQTGQRVTQAAGVQANLASLLGANATAYTRNQANNANMQGAESRSGLLSQLNNYMGDLAGKQSDIDSSRSQAVATGYQNYQDAARSLGLQKMQFDMQNSQNAYNAANQNNQNAMSMYNQFQSQQSAADAGMAASQSAAQSQANWQAEFGLKQQAAQTAAQAAAAKAQGASSSGGFVNSLANTAAGLGISGPDFQNYMGYINAGAAGGDGMSGNAEVFASNVMNAAAAKGAKVDKVALMNLAREYFYSSKAKTSSNNYG